MPWPFSRREPGSGDGDSVDADRRRGEARDPAAVLRAQTRRRLIGAAVLLLAAVLVLPMLLDPAPRPMSENLSISVTGQAPAAPAQPEKPPVVDEKIAEPAATRIEPESTAAPPPPAGTAPAVQPDDPAKPARAVQPPPTVAAANRFVVQVAALSTPAAADDLMVRLIKDGYTAYVEGASTAGGGTMHRVRVGPFASREQAQRAADRLRSAGHKAAIVGG